jgi:hypothetical protein
MRKTLSLLLVLVALFVMAPPSFAQTATYQTITSAAMNDSIGTVTLASMSNMVASSQGVTSLMFCDGEAFKINAINTTSLVANVTRGYDVTNASAHASNVVCFYGTQGGQGQNQLFVTQDKSGFGGNADKAPISGSACTRTNYAFLPLVNIQNNSLIDCVNTLSANSGTSAGRWRATSLAMFTGAHPLTSTGATYSITMADEFVRLGIPASVTFTLPPVTGITGKVVVVKHDAASGTLTIATPASQFVTTVGNTSTTLSAGGALRLVSVQSSSGAWGWATW